jgi:hypothetical protein
MTKIAGSVSESIGQRYEAADTDMYQNIMDRHQRNTQRRSNSLTLIAGFAVVCILLTILSLMITSYSFQFLKLYKEMQ